MNTLAVIMTAISLHSGSPDIDRLIHAIEAVENTPWTAPGGGLQFTPATWAEETRKEFSFASSRKHAREVAAARLSRFANRLKALGITPTPALMGSIWNKGFHGALSMRRDAIPDDYGERVSNYFYAYTK